MTEPRPAGRVLIVDDEARIANLLGELLGGLGYTVKVALTGNDALEQVAIFQPDVVMLDLTLPGVTGGEVLDSLRQTHPDVQIIAMTGDPARASGILARGAVAYLPKPFNVGTLGQIVREVLRDRA